MAPMLIFILLIMSGLQLKHFAADYLLQSRRMIAGKGSLRAPGGYEHAAVHVAGTAVVLIWTQLPLALLAAVLFGEFVIHYGLDYGKARLSERVSIIKNPKLFWALHGLDQLLHQVTYLIIALIAARARGL